MIYKAIKDTFPARLSQFGSLTHLYSYPVS